MKEEALARGLGYKLCQRITQLINELSHKKLSVKNTLILREVHNLHILIGSYTCAWKETFLKASSPAFIQRPIVRISNKIAMCTCPTLSQML